MAPLLEPGGLVQVKSGSRLDDNGATVAPEPLGTSYALENKVIGSGRFADVLEASHLATGARRAIKVIKKNELPKRELQANGSGLGCRELDILRRLDHPNVIRLYEAFEDESFVYLVLEFCEGADLLERVNGTKERLPEVEIAAIFVQTLCAVEHLWSHGVAHRDLKPEHFVFTRREPHRDPLPPRVAAMKLIDFGLSRRIERPRPPNPDVSARMRDPLTPRIGTVEFMSPETVAGKAQTLHLHKVDIWSLGVLLHIMLTGRYLSRRMNTMSTKEYFSKACWDHIAPDCLDLMGAMLQQDPALRPDAGVLMKHPFVRRALGPERPELVQRLPIAARAFACTKDLRRLALLMAAREADDCDVAEVRRLFQQLQIACGGTLTRAALQNAVGGRGGSGGPLGAVAAALVRSFDSIDSDGSETIDWTEVVAVTLVVADTLVSTMAPADGTNDGAAPHMVPPPPLDAQHLVDPSTLPPIPPLREDACWRAFDLLSQGASAVTSRQLLNLLSRQTANTSQLKTQARESAAPETVFDGTFFIPQFFLCSPTTRDVCDCDERGRRSPGGRQRGGAALEAVDPNDRSVKNEQDEIERLDRLLWEASPEGILDGKAFLRMIQGPVYTKPESGARLFLV